MLIGAVVYGNGTWILASHGSLSGGGQETVVSTSSDLMTWSAEGVGVNMGVENGIYANDTFVITGTMNDGTAFGSLITSADAVTWTPNVQPAGVGGFYDLAYGNGIWVGTPSYPNQIYTSATPGGPFSEVTDALGNTGNFGVGFAEGRFVVAASGKIQTSTDGTNWTEVTSGSRANLRGVVKGGDVWIAVGDGGAILRSTDDGITWSDAGPGGSATINSVTWDGTHFIAVGSAAWTSTDGTAWTQYSLGGFFPDMKAVAAGNGKVVAGGVNAAIRSGSDGSSWAQGTISPANATVTDIVFGNGTWVMASESFNVGQIHTSPDGTTWTQTQPENSRSFFGVTYGNGVFVVVGQHSIIGKSTILYSSDAQSWTATEINAAAGQIDFNGEQFVSIGGNKIFVSNDGAAWTEVAAEGTPWFSGSASSGNVLIGLLQNSTILRADLSLSGGPDLGIFNGSVSHGDDWYGSSIGLVWLGNWDTGWVYHAYMGYMYPSGTLQDLWFYAPTMGWIWTSDNMYPTLYAHDHSTWLSYQDGSNPAAFWDYTLQDWRTF